VSLVGYTNAGKSTLMNLLSHSDVFAENALFATLDTTVRKVVFENTPFLLSDTVGFIRKLPTFLIESFKSTLDEVREADILLHVVDLSHTNFEDQIKVVNSTLADLKAINKPILIVFNKTDLYKVQNDEGDTVPASLDTMVNSYIAKVHQPSVFISASQKSNIAELREHLLEMVKKEYVKRYPYLVVSSNK
jgi:GTP-binding protein HflX